MKNLTLLSTCEKDIVYCVELGKMFIRIKGKKDEIRYIPLTKFLRGENE